jgi:hypothetical protein
VNFCAAYADLSSSRSFFPSQIMNLESGKASRMELAENEWSGWWWVTNTAFKGRDVLSLIHLTMELASGIREGGSIKAALPLPTIKVVMLEKPSSLQTWMCVGTWHGQSYKQLCTLSSMLYARCYNA